MERLLIFIGMTVGGYVGWWAGESIGFGLMGSFVISTLASVVGIYAAWWVSTNYLS